jgi:hypothetical protein
VSLLPSNPASRRAEEAARERQRTEALDRIALMERKLDTAIMGSNAPSPAIQDLALAIGQDRLLLPLAVTISRTLNDEGEEVATAIRVGHLTFTIEEAVRLGVLTPEGRFSHYRAGVLLHSTPEPGTWVRPNQGASIPGRPRA